MNHLYKTITASVVPLIFLVRKNVAELLGAHNWLFEIDIAIFVLLATLTIVFWCLCLRQTQDIGFKMIVVFVLLYVAVLASHVTLIMISLMYDQHPDWQHAIVAALSKQLFTMTAFPNVTAETTKMNAI